ncbi:phospho-2-dehydro-3-deoxyheptonate aldolase [Alcanivorax jadensis T9]|jgi:3-deoxy-7-phosphoheptulonate synthase|uniref:Phospho-2-dehydro-3-deoxyheptonate aldolase n=1 Tax=Alcanivorax jadensis T9 TaxID=1177181 RepID=A0ABR4WCB8_9GAMM|nr:3-deoxy-7-phosphoheptulonate synthase [Alcanivorax jadensis]KGD60978.1 phospho-2-dehydro-3-deoxyheptonate aldolase [Alcanivorax jadensis T9]MBP21246.1 3-deoxy-7-phosphoheptulonate synthase [Alcanivorax sp.]|tara:strand:+ start:200 stop:1240 length:1041 start_codon:yes stop_codon:yes gene_type:complete
MQQTQSTTTPADTSPRRSLPLPSPTVLRDRLPVDVRLAAQIQAHRQTVRDILNGTDDRLLVITGPCSLHDPKAALEYGHRLSELSRQLDDKVFLVMRAYVEKPRTTVGWKGMLYDPHLDGSNDIATGLNVSRHLLLDLARLGLPLATELLHPMAADYLGDLLSWAAIGARTTESQIHREMVSGLSMPVGFKNGTDGSIDVASDAMGAAEHPHTHLGIDDNGHSALLQTAGNPDTHLVLRGGHQGPNYDADSIRTAVDALQAKGRNPRLIVDCSHANSGKDPLKQPEVLNDLLEQRRKGEKHIAGVMLESHLQDGKQPLQKPLQYGLSITDGCLGWDRTEQLLCGID